MSLADQRGWPAHLKPGAVRFAHASANYEETIAFYRDIVGVPVIGSFAGSFGEDGTILGFADTAVQLEIVRAKAGDRPAAGEFDQVVFYLDNPAAVVAATDPLRAVGLTAKAKPHPYWAANGALTFQDPDGRDVVFAPWVFGRDPEPADHGLEPEPELTVDWYDGDREALRQSFAEAEDSTEQLDRYLKLGRVLVACRGPRLLGHLQLIPYSDHEVEIKNMAVAANSRRTGVGRRLIDAALEAGRAGGATGSVVATAAADIGNLRFYQRCGFRLSRLERDAFTPATGYPEPIEINGIPLRDRVWLDQSL
jgi:GNAT superfamily N-acetyltransferase